MRPCRSEDDFQRWAVDIFDRIGHAQSHILSNQPDIPDLSAAVNGVDLWLELKYGLFNMAAGPEGRDYDEFEFREVKRGQLDWLEKRAEHGAAICGIFGYMDILPSRATQYVFFMDAPAYLKYHFKKTAGRFCVGSVLLSRFALPFEEVYDDPAKLMKFLKTASRLSKLPLDHPDQSIIGIGSKLDR